LLLCSREAGLAIMSMSGTEEMMAEEMMMTEGIELDGKAGGIVTTRQVAAARKKEMDALVAARALLHGGKNPTRNPSKVNSGAPSGSTTPGGTRGGSRAGSSTGGRKPRTAASLRLAGGGPSLAGSGEEYCFGFVTQKICMMQRGGEMCCGRFHLRSCQDEDQVKEFVDYLMENERKMIKQQAANDAVHLLWGSGGKRSGKPKNDPEFLTKLTNMQQEKLDQGSRHFQSSTRAVHAMNVAELAWLQLEEHLHFTEIPEWLKEIFEMQTGIRGRVED